MTNPISYEIDVDTGYRPHEHQYEIHQQMKRFSVLVCHRRFGKTVLAGNSLLDSALTTDRPGPPARFGYVAPWRIQAKKIAWPVLKRHALRVPGAKANESELSITFPNEAIIQLEGAENADALRGGYYDGLVLDEVADMKPHVWGEILRPTLGDYKGWALFIGTPKGLNLFSDLYYGALEDPAWYAGMYTVNDTRLPWLDEEELDLARKSMSDAQFRQEFMCDFGASSDNSLIPLDVVNAAFGKHLRADQFDRMPRIVGVDVARFGNDRSVIQKRQGLACFEPMIYRGLDNMALAGIVAREIVQWKPDAVFIDAGRGEGVIDRLRQLGHGPIEVNFGGRPLDTQRYANKRSEMWDSTREWLESGGALPRNDELRASLVVPTYSFDAAGRMVLEPKDKMKERVGMSPDPGDALALTFAAPVAVGSGAGARPTANNQYDLYGG